MELLHRSFKQIRAQLNIISWTCCLQELLHRLIIILVDFGICYLYVGITLILFRRNRMFQLLLMIRSLFMTLLLLYNRIRTLLLLDRGLLT